MSKLIFAVRRFVASNISWFQETRKFGESGRERAVNINTSVLDAWYPEGIPSGTQRVFINTSYFNSHETNPELTTTIARDSDGRPIANQGGGKNWRLAGDAIKGEFYGTIRTYDLMLMMFDIEKKELAWMCIRQSDDAHRTVPAIEQAAYIDIINLLGRPNADRNMWLPDPNIVSEIISHAKKAHPLSGVLLMQLQYLHEQWRTALDSNHVKINIDMTGRFLSSLLTKNFVILTGQTGSGKTKLAQSLAYWLCGDKEQFEIVSVGADWTSNENILGYADALDKSRYVKTTILEVILRASNYSEVPHFLILDEMNLSHVERYFADILSSLESGETLKLHSDASDRDGVPPQLKLPENLFIIGTINVDETTYMFSPKVLDRANVMEFKVFLSDLEAFLNNPLSIDLNGLTGTGSGFEKFFLETARKDLILLEDEERQKVKLEMTLLFSILSNFGAEFGYRTAKEVSRFVAIHKQLLGTSWKTELAIDAQVVQKIMPKLNGSRKKLEPILTALSVYCFDVRNWNMTSTGVILVNYHSILNKAIEAGKLIDDSLNPFAKDASGNELYPANQASLLISYNKILRMLQALDQYGFVSFSEG